MNKFNNRLSSNNLAINTTKWYNLQEDMKIWGNCKRNEMQNAIHAIFSCDNYGNFPWKALNDVNEVDNIHFQTRKNLEKLKPFFA